jgi:hypothetical protein
MRFHLSDFLYVSSADDDWLARYVVSQARLGRRLVDVLRDPIVMRRCDASTRARALDRSDVVAALAEIAVGNVHDEIDRGRARLGGTAAG